MYKDIISKSRLICSGPPAVYQVKPKKEIIETLTKLTIGERNLNKANRAILLVGETGAGKSSLVNALLNYAMGVKFEDDIWFQIVDEEKKKQTTSLTSDVIIYQIFGYEDQILPFSLTIIDTPGYGDTRGIKHDAIVSERLLDLFAAEDGVIEINAVALVMKASDNRLSDRLRYIFNSVMSLFGKNLENKIVVLITHSDGRKPENVLKALEKEGIRSAKNEEDEAVHFLFNNRQEDERTEEDPEYLKHLSKISERGFRAFTDLLEKSAPQRLKTTTKVLKERRKLTASIQDLEDRIKKIELKETEIKQIKEDLKRAEDENNHVVMVDEVYKEKKTIKGGSWGIFFNEGAVCCTVCEETCHYPCTLASKPERCDIIQSGHCTACTGKCPVSDHVKENWIYEVKIRKVQKTKREMKQTNDKETSESQKKASLLQSSENELKQLTAEKTQLVDKAYQHVLKLEQMALQVKSLNTYLHIDFLLEKMKEKRDTEKVKKLEEMKSRLVHASSKKWFLNSLGFIPCG
uniref:AIG1-type G domain-containing protein n=1 Tax=Poecilia reticulata TaxID=8081 RepID=A0A3P9PET5_POERE